MGTRWMRTQMGARWAGAVGLACGGFSLVAPAHAGVITGVCPDGSVYIVKHARQIPCQDSKQVEPGEVPPMRPEYLPTPYTWRVWQEHQNPNNPYNLIDAAREVRTLRTPPTVRGEGPPQTAGETTPPEPAGAMAPTLPNRPLALGLSDDELRSLYQIVELSQETSPVQFARNTADGRGVFRIAFARSAAFEGRLREAWRSRGGLGGATVVLFTAFSKQPADFEANFTFVQGPMTYQPDATNARQLGVLQGRLGKLEGGEAVLGYIVLPETLESSAEFDLYWNDRRTTARFSG